LDRSEFLAAERQFAEDPDRCILMEGNPRIYKNYIPTPLARRLWEIWQGVPLDPTYLLFAGPCGKNCHNPTHRIKKGPYPRLQPKG